MLRKPFFVLFALFVVSCAPPVAPSVKPFADYREFILLEPLTYRIGETKLTLTVPAGFVTDYASIPQALWSIVPPQDNYAPAAIIHDYLYWTQSCTKDQADTILLIAMKELGVSTLKQQIVFQGVQQKVRILGTTFDLSGFLGSRQAWDGNRTTRQAGLPRVVPEGMRKPAQGVLWEDYRRTLKAEGVVDPPMQVDPAFCACGNSLEVPKGSSCSTTTATLQ